jgi:hypothetical protein
LLHVTGTVIRFFPLSISLPPVRTYPLLSVLSPYSPNNLPKWQSMTITSVAKCDTNPISVTQTVTLCTALPPYPSPIPWGTHGGGSAPSMQTPCQTAIGTQNCLRRCNRRTECAAAPPPGVSRAVSGAPGRPYDVPAARLCVILQNRAQTRLQAGSGLATAGQQRCHSTAAALPPACCTPVASLPQLGIVEPRATLPGRREPCCAPALRTFMRHGISTVLVVIRWRHGACCGGMFTLKVMIIFGRADFSS